MALLNFRDIHPRKKAYYYGDFVGIAVAKCNTSYSREIEYLVKIENTRIIEKPWIGTRRDDIPKKYQTDDYYWFFTEDPDGEYFRMEGRTCEEFEIE